MPETGNRDYLTGSYNRKWLFEDCPVCSQSGQFSVIYIDVDNFKPVNDLYGHEAGDRVLQYVANAIRDCAPAGYPVRLSGDEFVLVLPGEWDKEQLESIYEKIVRSIALGQSNDMALALISLSAGVMTREYDEQSLQDILECADKTMYTAKRSGKRRCVFYDDIREDDERSRRIVDEVSSAVADDRFEFRFNPLLNMQSGMLEMTRVTAYWLREDGTVLEPSEYRPVLEGNGYVRVLDMYLLEKLFSLLSEINLEVYEEMGLRFSIELSWIHFLDRRLDKMLLNLSEKYKVKLSDIDIAVSENSITARDTDRLIFGMKRIAEMNISISIKNFGSCFASVRYMNRLPVGTFVFDSKWLSENLIENNDRRLVRSTIRLVKDAHKTIVAFGYADKMDREFLTACGCDAMGDKSESSFYEYPDYAEFVSDKLLRKCGAVYDFCGDLKTVDAKNEGAISGDGVTYEKGVTDERGALRFAGGAVGENVVELPPSLFSKDSYTISLWVYPEKEMNWASALYARFDGGFISFVPYTNADDGISVFRISVDEEGFFDTTCRAMMMNEWSHICIAYDAKSESVRMYINGRKGPASNGGMPMMRGCRKVVIGGDPFQRSYVGSISSLCIYNYALSGNEVKDLYESYTKERGFKGFREEYWMDTE